MPHPAGRSWIIAHRGASHRARENTIEAFRRAAELGADAVELDVRRTADGALVVHHDATIIGADRPIIAQTRAEVRATDPLIPDLDEALLACQDMWVDVEIKNDPRDPDWDPDQTVASTIAREYAGSGILVTSFDPAAVAVAHSHDLWTGLLLLRGVDPLAAAAAVAEAGHRVMLPHFSTLAGEHGHAVIAAAGACGIEVMVWTVDDPGDIARMAHLGVGGICSNLPDVARSVVEHGDGEDG